MTVQSESANDILGYIEELSDKVNFGSVSPLTDIPSSLVTLEVEVHHILPANVMKPPESSYSKPFMQGIYRIVLNEHVQFIQSVDPEISQVKSAVNTCHCKAESLRVNQRNSFFTDTTNSA